MKSYFLIFLFFSVHIAVFSQNSSEVLTGKVSYISSQNVYVKFENTDGIQVGDTLFTMQDNKPQPALIVTSLSTISCIGTPVSGSKLSSKTQIIAKKKITKTEITEKAKEPKSVNEEAIVKAFKKKKAEEPKARFDGRLSVSSYTNVSNYNTNQRFRYNLTLNAPNIGNSNLSFDSYLSFTHLISFPAKTTDWQGLNNALKIYSLSFKYDLSKTASISLGRRINVNMANIGAVDGLQFENTGKYFSYGALIGSRPNDLTYGFDSKLVQYGGFLSHHIENTTGNMQTSFAFFNQMNNFKTDRRFAYFQHTNSLLKNFDLFCSFEFDLYKVLNSVPLNTFDLTSTYVSLRYKPVDNLSLSLAYDARKNVYYYETYPQNKLDSILDKETRQGLRFNFYYRPFKNFTWGGNANYRLPSYINSDTVPTMNASSFISYSRLPLDIYGTINVMALRSVNTDGMVYGISLSRDFFAGKVNAQVDYRMTNYSRKSVLTSSENTATVSIFWRIARKTTISGNFEGTFTKDANYTTPNNYGRMYINISQRF